jgi:hypothetical protein
MPNIREIDAGRIIVARRIPHPDQRVQNVLGD